MLRILFSPKLQLTFVQMPGQHSVQLHLRRCAQLKANFFLIFFPQNFLKTPANICPNARPALCAGRISEGVHSWKLNSGAGSRVALDFSRLGWNKSQAHAHSGPGHPLCMLEWGVRVLFWTNVSWRLLSSIALNVLDKFVNSIYILSSNSNGWTSFKAHSIQKNVLGNMTLGFTPLPNISSIFWCWKNCARFVVWIYRNAPTLKMITQNSANQAKANKQSIFLWLPWRLGSRE